MPRALFAATRVGSVGCERRRAPGDRGSHADERGVEPRGMGKVRREGVARGPGNESKWVVRASSRASGVPPVPIAISSSLKGRCGRCPMWAQLGQARSRSPRSTLIWEIPVQSLASPMCRRGLAAPVKRQAERDATGHCMSQPERVEGAPRLVADPETEFNVLMSIGKASTAAAAWAGCWRSPERSGRGWGGRLPGVPEGGRGGPRAGGGLPWRGTAR